MLTRYFLRLTLIFVILSMLVSPGTSYAQPVKTVVSIGLPPGTIFNFQETVLPQLTSANPTIQYRLVTVDWPQSSFADPANLEKYDKSLQAAVSSADVLMTLRSMVNIYGTRAGYFLDMKSLIANDSAFQQTDFLPASWQAYQWDGGQWAAPMLYGLDFFTYDAKAFNTSNLSYPNANWTLDEMANTIRKLAIRTGDKVSMPGFYIDDYSLPGLLRAMSGDTFTTPDSLPATPHLATSTLAKSIETWAQLEREGFVTNRLSEDEIGKIPFQISDTFTLRQQIGTSGGDSRVLVGTSLPGDSAILDVYGLAVSRGTAHPDQAYQTIKALTALHDVGLFGGTRTARADAKANYFGFGLSTDNAAFLANLTPKAQPTTNLLFGDYLRGVIDAVKAGSSALDALGKADVSAIQMLKIAEAQKTKISLVVNNPTPEVNNLGKQTIKFTLFTGNGSGSANLAMWQKWLRVRDS